MWTDERLDDRFTSIDRRFDELIGEVRQLRAEMHRDILHLTLAMIGAFAAQYAALIVIAVS